MKPLEPNLSMMRRRIIFHVCWLNGWLSSNAFPRFRPLCRISKTMHTLPLYKTLHRSRQAEIGRQDRADLIHGSSPGLCPISVQQL